MINPKANSNAGFIVDLVNSTEIVGEVVKTSNDSLDKVRVLLQEMDALKEKAIITYPANHHLCENAFNCKYVYSFLLLELFNGKGSIPSFQGTCDLAVGCMFKHSEEQIEQMREAVKKTVESQSKRFMPSLEKLIEDLWTIDMQYKESDKSCTACKLGTVQTKTYVLKFFDFSFIRPSGKKFSSSEEPEKKKWGGGEVVYNPTRNATSWASAVAGSGAASSSSSSKSSNLESPFSVAERMRFERLERQAKEEEERVQKLKMETEKLEREAVIAQLEYEYKQRISKARADQKKYAELKAQKQEELKKMKD